MKVLLRKTGTQLLFNRTGDWAVAFNEAFDFGTIPQAVKWAVELGLNDVEVVLWFGDPALDMVLPLPRPSTGP
jgi:hypothetical protein